ncbi:MAG: class I SAM-dependent methyltransferase [Kordiimonadaceae bacterium]|nr:class I SAM-dependent methyltransferase [Kordiimonadaceae bacterium]
MEKTFTAADFWDERFQDQDYIYGVEANGFLSDNAGLFKSGGVVLSLGEGEGRNIVFLAELGCKTRGIDFSKTGRDKALRLAKMKNVNIDYEIADISTYTIGKNEWDAIISIFYPISEDIRIPLFQSIKNALKPGGIFLLESYNKKQLEYNSGGPKDITHLLSLSELTEEFQNFEIILARDIIRNIQEGNHHNGLSSVTQFIVRKPL